MAAAVPQQPAARSVAAAQPDQPLWHGASGRFTRSATRTPATAMVAAAGREGPDAGDQPRRRNGAPGAQRSPVTPTVALARAATPPDPTQAWTAEIEWREIRGEAHFYVVAQGAGTVEVAQSPALAWPPEGDAEVQAVATAADELAATVVTAGWKELPAGTAWYAKRFAWEPVAAAPAEEVKPPARVERPKPPPKRVAPAARPPKRVAPAAAAGNGDGVPAKRSRAKAVAVLGLLAIVGVIAALQLRDGGDEGRRSAPSGGLDLTIPLLALVSLVFLVLLIREMRRKSR